MDAKNLNLQKAKSVKNDEFYTKLEDIQNELCHYESFFKGKIVYCNCDDPFESNFFRYFTENFRKLGLKQLLITGFNSPLNSDKPVSLFPNDEPVNESQSYFFKIKDIEIKEGRWSRTFVRKLLRQKGVVKRLLTGDATYKAGDFRSKECLFLLRQADIVVTNPPFSLWREFISVLEEYEKKYLIIGNKNLVTYKKVFPLIKDCKMWFGCTDVKEFYDKNGNICKFGNISWFTNIPVKKELKEIELTEHYYDENGKPKKESLEKYLPYDNYDAINVDRLKDIPCDYYGVMGVPITFLDKFNPSYLYEEMDDAVRKRGLPSLEQTKPKEQVCQTGCGQAESHPVVSEGNGSINESSSNGYAEWFDIVTIGTSPDLFTPSKKYYDVLYHGKNNFVGKEHIAVNQCLTIRVKEKPNPVYYTAKDVDGYLIMPYNRILIIRKKDKLIGRCL